MIYMLSDLYNFLSRDLFDPFPPAVRGWDPFERISMLTLQCRLYVLSRVLKRETATVKELLAGARFSDGVVQAVKDLEINLPSFEGDHDFWTRPDGVQDVGEYILPHKAAASPPVWTHLLTGEPAVYKSIVDAGVLRSKAGQDSW
jgi:hypothetical protein